MIFYVVVLGEVLQETMAFLLSIIINQLQTHQRQLHCLKCECWCVWERDIIHKSYFNHEKYLNRTVLTWDLLSKPLSKVQNTNEVPSPTRMSLKSAKCSSFRKKRYWRIKIQLTTHGINRWDTINCMQAIHCFYSFIIFQSIIYHPVMTNLANSVRGI